jgi:hypothetical protein
VAQSIERVALGERRNRHPRQPVRQSRGDHAGTHSRSRNPLQLTPLQPRPPERRNVTAKCDHTAWLQPVKVCVSELLTERGYANLRRS